MKNILIKELNPLYFPQMNEYGEHWQPYFKAFDKKTGKSGYGRTPELAMTDLNINTSKNEAQS